MADREKVIKGLEEVDAYFHRMTEVCYRGDEATFCDLKEKVADAIALLKEQEPKTILGIADSIEGIEVGKCPRCERTILSKQSDPTWFCKYCGQAVKWE